MTRVSAILLISLWACSPVPHRGSSPDYQVRVSDSEPEVLVEVEQSQVGPEQPVFVEQSIWLPDGWNVESSELSAPGMDIQRLSVSDPVVDGERQLRITRYALDASPGRYIIVPGVYSFTGPSEETVTIEPLSIFVDLGVTEALPTTLTEFERSPVSEVEATQPPFPWWPLVTGSLVLAALLFWAWKRRRSRRVPLHPMEQALEDWADARRSISDAQELAYHLSWVFRGYLEAMDDWPARKRTSPEVLIWLESERDPVLTGELLASAERILRATDRLKFSGEGGGGLFFDQLETDLRVVLMETRARAEKSEADTQHG